MPYDHPYRLEDHAKMTLGGKAIDNYAIVRTGVGIICEGSDLYEMQKIVDALNEMCQMEKT